MSRLVWNKGMEARLIKAWNAGVPASLLGERFGTSGAAIIVKIGALRANGVELRYDLRRSKTPVVGRLRACNFTAIPIAAKRPAGVQ